MNESSAAYMKEMREIQAFLNASLKELTSGAMPDVTGLEAKVTAMCAQVQSAPPEVQKLCLPALSALMQTLDAVELGMRNWYAAAMKIGGSS